MKLSDEQKDLFLKYIEETLDSHTNKGGIVVAKFGVDLIKKSQTPEALILNPLVRELIEACIQAPLIEPNWEIVEICSKALKPFEKALEKK